MSVFFNFWIFILIQLNSIVWCSNDKVTGGLWELLPKKSIEIGDALLNHPLFQKSSLHSNIEECAEAMQKHLTNILIGSETRISRGFKMEIKEIKCLVEQYDLKTKMAIINCYFLSEDLIKVPALRFRAQIKSEFDEVKMERDISMTENEIEDSSLDENDWEDISVEEGEIKKESISDDVIVDNQSIEFEEKSNEWNACLNELFHKSRKLNFINPNGNYNIKGSGSVFESSGRLSLTISLANMSVGICEYNLLSQSKDFYYLYKSNPSMFFSIFSDLIATHPFPSVCSSVLEPPSISRKNSGNFEKIIETLTGIFDINRTMQYGDGMNTLGLKVKETFTNLPMNNPYHIFKLSFVKKISECLAQDDLEKKLYDCNSPLTLWADPTHCPDTCLSRPGGQELSLCSSVLDCGDGVFLGFKETKLFNMENGLKAEFNRYLEVIDFEKLPSYFSAFYLKTLDGWNQFKFAVFFSYRTRNTFIRRVIPSKSSVGAEFSLQQIQKDVAIKNESSEAGQSIKSEIDFALNHDINCDIKQDNIQHDPEIIHDSEVKHEPEIKIFSDAMSDIKLDSLIKSDPKVKNDTDINCDVLPEIKCDNDQNINNPDIKQKRIEIDFEEVDDFDIVFEDDEVYDFSDEEVVTLKNTINTVEEDTIVVNIDDSLKSSINELVEVILEDSIEFTLKNGTETPGEDTTKDSIKVTLEDIITNVEDASTVTIKEALNDIIEVIIKDSINYYIDAAIEHARNSMINDNDCVSMSTETSVDEVESHKDLTLKLDSDNELVEQKVISNNLLRRFSRKFLKIMLLVFALMSAMEAKFFPMLINMSEENHMLMINTIVLLTIMGIILP